MIYVEENEKGEPLSFTTSRIVIEVLRVEDSWRGKNYTYYKLLSKDMDEWILKKESPQNRWTFIYYKKANISKFPLQHQIPDNQARTQH